MSARPQGYTAFVCIVLLMRVCEIAGGKCQCHSIMYQGKTQKDMNSCVCVCVCACVCSCKCLHSCFGVHRAVCVSGRRICLCFCFMSVSNYCMNTERLKDKANNKSM